MASAVEQAPARRVSSLMPVMLLAWLAMVGADLFLHAGLLAPLYDWDSPFLLPPDDAFVRIPVGYAGLLLLAAALVWLLPRLGVERARDGALLAAAGGAVVWGAIVLGLWSISTADPALLGAWWAAQTAELAVAGSVVGAALGRTRLRRLAALVGAIVVIGAISAVVLQSVGYAPAPVLTPP